MQALRFQMVTIERGFYQMVKYLGRGILKIHQVFPGSEYCW